MLYLNNLELEYFSSKLNSVQIYILITITNIAILKVYLNTLYLIKILFTPQILFRIDIS